MTLPRSLALSVLALLLVLAGCGGESDEDAAVDALAADLQENGTLEQAAIDADDAQCAARRVVRALGADRVEEIGFVDEGEDADLDELSDDEITTVARSLLRCIDGIEDVLTSALRDGLLDESTIGLPLTEENADCVTESILEGFGPEQLLVLTLTGDGDGLSEGALTEGEARIVADGFVDCVDLRPVFAEQFEAEGLPAEVAACLAREIPADNLRALFAAEFSGGGVDPESLLAPALGVCGLD